MGKLEEGRQNSGESRGAGFLSQPLESIDQKYKKLRQHF